MNKDSKEEQQSFNIGDRVRILTGAWKGQCGVVNRLIPENGCYSVTVDMLNVAFGPEELEKTGLHSI